MNRGCQKRLIKEKNDLEKMDSVQYVNLEFNDYLDKYKDTKPTIEIFTNNMIIKFIFSYDYPFKPPKLLLNDKPYYNYLKINNPENLKTLKEKFGMKCLCCETITCPHKWTPALRLNSFIDEIHRFRKIKIYLESKRIGPIMLNIINKYKNYILPPEIILYICQFF